MTSQISTYAKGRFVDRCDLLLGTDTIGVTLLQTTGLAGDTTLVNCQYLSALLAVSQEATFTNFTRMFLTKSSVQIAYNTTSSPTSVAVSFATQTWNSAGGALNNNIAKVVLFYQPTSATPDSQCLVLATLDYTGSTTGGAFGPITIGTLTDN